MFDVFATCWSTVELSLLSTSELFTLIFLLVQQNHKHPHLEMGGGKKIFALQISISSFRIFAAKIPNMNTSNQNLQNQQANTASYLR